MEVFRKTMPKEKRPAGREPKWTAEYMHMVVRKVVEEGMTYRKAAETFGTSQGSVAAWIRLYRKGTLVPVDKRKEPPAEIKIYRLEEQVKDLKREIGDLYLETQMLKKALFHSQSLKKPNSSVITSENLAQYQEAAK